MQIYLILILIALSFKSINSQNFNPLFGNFQIQPQLNPLNFLGQFGFQQQNQPYNQPNNQQYGNNPNRPNNNQNRPANSNRPRPNNRPNNRPVNNQNPPVPAPINTPIPAPFDPITRVDQPSIVSPTNSPIPQQNLRLSERKCKEYSEKSKGSVFVGSLSFIPSIQDIKTEQCDSSQGLIVGGENAKPGEFPHMAAIGYRNIDNVIDFKCGGSIISERYVLTAAHCRTAERDTPTLVRVGDLNLKSKEKGLPEEDIPIESFISHEQYNPSISKNDIAVMKLTRNIQFSKHVRPACLMTTNNEHLYSKAIASGWGYTDALSGGTSDIMQKVELSIIDNNKCNQIFDDPTYYNLDNTQMCAGELQGGKDTCRGDSGGPLQIVADKSKCAYTLIGITSYGSVLCGSKNSPGVYTRVSSYLDWIEDKVWRS